MLLACNTLEALWRYTDELHDKRYPDHDLRPILGNGKTLKPDVMFVFINPTARNVSTSRTWRGPRFPFIGTRQVWRIFHRAGLVDDLLMRRIEESPSEWSLELTQEVLAFLRRKRFYVTNIVKWAGHDAALPDKEKINLFLPILEREIAVVRPAYVVAFGLIPFEALTQEDILLKQYHSQAMRTRQLQFYSRRFGTVQTKIIPCYFPIGRGDPKKAVDLLRLLPSKRFAKR